jgi:hypothetical protein
MLSPDLVSKRFEYAIIYQNEHYQPQIFARLTKRATSGEDCIRIYGIGLDMWHLLRIDSGKFFLISLSDITGYLYINHDIYPCPVFERIKSRNNIINLLNELIEHKGETWLTPVQKLSEKQKKEAVLLSFLQAAKEGKNIGFANKIGRKIKR